MLLRAVKKSLNNLIRVSKETVNNGQASINSRLKKQLKKKKFAIKFVPNLWLTLEN